MMDGLLSVVTVASMLCTAGFCENSNYVAAFISIGVMGFAGFVINRRYERECKRRRSQELRRMARQINRCA